MTFDAGERRPFAELSAVQEGFGPMYAEWAKSLGTLSHAASQIEDVQDGLEKARANEIILREVADLLPHATGKWYQNSVKNGGHDLGRFEFGGEDQQYKSRVIQATTVWLRLSAGDGVEGYMPFKSNVPCYVIGRRVDSEMEYGAQLLLLPASGIVDGIPHDRECIPPRTVIVRKDDLAARDQYALHLFDKEFSDADRSAMLRPSIGRLVVASDTPGSIVLTRRGIGQASVNRVRDKGLRHDPRKAEVLSHGISDETLDGFEVDTTVAHLVIAFGVADAYRVILEKGRLQDSLMLTREVRLAAQNSELRAALGRMILASGIFSEEVVSRQLNTIYPPI